MSVFNPIYPPSSFKKDGSELTEEEYQALVREKFSDQVVINEINRLANECAEVAAGKTLTHEETQFQRGGIRFAEKLRALKDKQGGRVKVK